MLRRSAPAALLVAGLVVVSGTSGAVAGTLITGKDIKDGTVAGRDIQDFTLGKNDTSSSLDRYLQRVSGYKAVHVTSPVQPGNSGQVASTCPGDSKIIGSASWWTSSVDGTQVQVASTADYTKSATAYGQNDNGFPDTLNLVLWCGRTVG